MNDDLIGLSSELSVDAVKSAEDDMCALGEAVASHVVVAVRRGEHPLLADERAAAVRLRLGVLAVVDDELSVPRVFVVVHARASSHELRHRRSHFSALFRAQQRLPAASAQQLATVDVVVYLMIVLWRRLRHEYLLGRWRDLKLLQMAVENRLGLREHLSLIRSHHVVLGYLDLLSRKRELRSFRGGKKSNLILDKNKHLNKRVLRLLPRPI